VFIYHWLILSKRVEGIESTERLSPLMSLLGLLASILAAYVLRRLIVDMGVYDVAGAVKLAFVGEHTRFRDLAFSFS